MASEKRRWYQSRLSLRTRLLLAIPFALVFSFSLVPTRLERLSTEHPPIEDRTARRAVGTGCALDEVTSGTGCVHVEVTAVREEEVQITSSIPEKGLAALRGTLTLPELSGPRPAIILLHGSGPQDRDAALPGDLVTRVKPPFPILRALAAFFAHEGFVVLRWDKRGPKNYPVLAGEGLAKTFRFSDFERDARDALAFLALRPEVDPTTLAVAGHSEGGAVAANVAAAEPRVAALILLGAYVDAFDAGAWQIRHHADTRLAQADVIGWIALSWMARSQRRCIDKLTTAYDPDETCIGGPTTQAVVKDVVEYQSHTLEKLAAVSCPIFALQGSVDRNIDPSTIPRMQQALAGRDAEFHYVPKVSHLMVDAIDPKQPAVLDAEVEGRLRTFLGSVKRR